MYNKLEIVDEPKK